MRCGTERRRVPATGMVHRSAHGSEEQRSSRDSDSSDDDAFLDELEEQLHQRDELEEQLHQRPKRIKAWPLDENLVQLVCAFAGRRCGTVAVSPQFFAARERLRRAEKRRALAAKLPADLARRVEEALWRGDRRTYEARTRAVVFALRKNDELRGAVLDGSSTPDALAALDEEGLAPRAVNARRDDERRRAAACRAARSRPPALVEIDAFACPRCGERRSHCVSATHKASIDRSHVLALCLACDLRWEP